MNPFYEAILGVAVALVGVAIAVKIAGSIKNICADAKKMREQRDEETEFYGSSQ